MGSRIRKGEKIRTKRRIISLMDASAQFIYGLYEGGCSLTALEMLQHNMKSLSTRYMLTVVLLRILGNKFEDEIEKSEYSGKTDADSLEKYRMKKLFDSLIPENQTRASILNRCI